MTGGGHCGRRECTQDRKLGHWHQAVNLSVNQPLKKLFCHTDSLGQTVKKALVWRFRIIHMPNAKYLRRGLALPTHANSINASCFGACTELINSISTERGTAQF